MSTPAPRHTHASVPWQSDRRERLARAGLAVAAPYRFICDALPILWWLLAWVVVRHGLTLGLRLALAAGIVVNVYGIVAIWGMGFVDY